MPADIRLLTKTDMLNLNKTDYGKFDYIVTAHFYFIYIWIYSVAFNFSATHDP